MLEGSNKRQWRNNPRDVEERTEEHGGKTWGTLQKEMGDMKERTKREKVREVKDIKGRHEELLIKNLRDVGERTGGHGGKD